jgi:vacuolar-type H+-ATPase subunit H
LELQHEGPAALLGRPEIAKQLNITDEERNQFIGIVQGMQNKMQTLMKEAHDRGNPEQIRLEATQIYADQESNIEAILSDPQKEKWKEMLGKPFDVFNDN